MQTQIKGKITKTDDEGVRALIQDLARDTGIALLLLTKGKVSVEANEEGVRLLGDLKDIEVCKPFANNSEGIDMKAAVSAMHHFGWDVELGEGNNLTGKDAFYFMLFMSIMRMLEPWDIHKVSKDMKMVR